MAVKQFETIVAHAKNSGFVFQGSEIYGGLSNTWDFGPLGVELKDNIKRAWWKKFIQSHPNNVGIQAAILMNPKVWEASGHLKGFSDPLMDCRHCKTRHRADHLIEEATEGKVVPEGWSNEKMMDFIKENHIACPNCGSHDFTDIRQFNLMFKTFQGILEDAKNTIYLRPETAQGMFVDFKNVQRSMRRKLPFGIGRRQAVQIDLHDIAPPLCYHSPILFSFILCRRAERRRTRRAAPGRAFPQESRCGYIYN